MSKPLIGVVSDLQLIKPHAFHTAGDKYLRALAVAADVIPVIIPGLTDVHDIEQWVSRLDGLFLTGAYSMVDPKHYEESKIDRPYRYDEQRDTLSFNLLSAVLEKNIPLLGSCRGLQDLNVFCGGSLHQSVHDVAGLNDHREDQTASLEQQYGDVHRVSLTSGGLLESITGCRELQVNSLHNQGINQLGKGLHIEATADDGLVEAIRVESLTFGLAVQWHPEWQVQKNPQQTKIFQAFGEACKT